VRDNQRTRKLFGSPAQAGPNGYGAPIGRFIETEHDYHPKVLRAVRYSRALKRYARNRAAYSRQSNFMAAHF
jgi:hypothetical protein